MKGLVAFGVVVVLGLVVVFGYFGFSNTANQYEIGIKAQYKDNQNVYDNGWKEVKEKAQVPEMYTEDLKKVYDGVMKGRYGEKGSQALLQFIQEQNPQLSPELYRQIQQSIETFRKRFTQSQTELVARRQAYETFIYATFTGRIFNTIGGYPRIDLLKFDIVTSEETERVFENKKADEIKLRPQAR